MLPLRAYSGRVSKRYSYLQPRLVWTKLVVVSLKVSARLLGPALSTGQRPFTHVPLAGSGDTRTKSSDEHTQLLEARERCAIMRKNWWNADQVCAWRSATLLNPDAISRLGLCVISSDAYRIFKREERHLARSAYNLDAL